MNHRIWSRVLVTFLAVALILTTACSGNGGDGTTTAGTTTAGTTTAATTTVATTTAGTTTAATTTEATTAPSTDGPAPSITWYAATEVRTDEAMVFKVLNEYILEKINVNVTINNYSAADYTEKIPVMLNSGQEMDMIICNAYFNTAIADMVKIDALTPVTQYMDTLLTDVVSILPENIWKDATYKSEIWGVPLYKNRVRNYDFIYNEDLANELGVGEFMSTLEWDFYPDLMEKLYTVKDAMDDTGFYYPYVTTLGGPTSPRTFAAMDILQGDNEKKAYAAINIDGEVALPSQENGKVYNTYGTDEFYDWCGLAYQWVQDAMIPPDDTKNLDPDNALRSNGELFAWGSSGLTSVAPHSVSDEFVTLLIRSNKAIGLSNASNGVFCVPSTSKNVEAAVKLMNLTNSDGYLATMFRYGIEGTHWKYGDDGQVTVEFSGSRNADPSNRGYYVWYGVYWGNLFIVSPAKESAEATFVQDLYNLNEVGSTVSKYYGFIFDIGEVADYVASVDNVVAQYLTQCGNGRLASVDEINKTVDAFNDAMAANGLDKIIAAAQTQLDAYAAENGIQ